MLIVGSHFDAATRYQGSVTASHMLPNSRPLPLRPRRHRNGDRVDASGRGSTRLRLIRSAWRRRLEGIGSALLAEEWISPAPGDIRISDLQDATTVSRPRRTIAVLDNSCASLHLAGRRPRGRRGQLWSSPGCVGIAVERPRLGSDLELNQYGTFGRIDPSYRGRC